MRRRRRSSGGGTSRLLLAALVCGGLVAAAEIAIRLARPQALTPAYAASDLDLGRAARPSVHYRAPSGGPAIDTNAQALRQPDDRDPSRRGVAVYGGASAFGAGLDYPETYFARIKATLEAEHPGIQLLNAAFPGYAGGQVHTLMARQLESLRPSALIYFFSGKDLGRNIGHGIRVTTFAQSDDGKVELTDIRPLPRWKILRDRYTPYAWLGRHSHLFVLAKERLKQSFGRGEPEPPAAIAPDSIDLAVAVSAAHLDRIADLAAKAELPLLVVWVPTADELAPADPPTPEQVLLTRGRAALADLARRRGDVVFIDTSTRDMPEGGSRFDAARHAWFAGQVTPALGEFITERVIRTQPPS